jgi:hypothetical protein
VGVLVIDSVSKQLRYGAQDVVTPLLERERREDVRLFEELERVSNVRKKITHKWMDGSGGGVGAGGSCKPHRT